MSSSNTVKTKRNDDVGIQKLPVQITDDNQNNFISTTAPNPKPTNPIVLNYYYNASASDKQTVQSQITKSYNDTESEKGWFGWEYIGDKFIPYILREKEKYCAVRMVDKIVLNRYLHKEIYSNCIHIRSSFMTEVECKLLNEINFIHCDTQFGNNIFTTRDLIVKFSDVSELYKFQKLCYYKIIGGNSNLEDSCGFIRIGGTSVVPYIIKDNIKYIPLFYFEMLGENKTENLNLKIELLKKWDLAYMKFLFTLQGIRKELFNFSTCAVVDVDIIKNYFPLNTLFENYWSNSFTQPSYILQTPWNGELVTYPKK